MQKSKGLVIGSTLSLALAGLGATGYYISGPSEQQIQATAVKEGFTPKPIIPVKGDVPTIGHGTTVYENGVKVKMSDPAITRKQAFEYLKAHVNKDAQMFNKTILNVPISQIEYDAYIDFTYQFGIGNWRKSSMLKKLKSGKYVQACNHLLGYRFQNGRDCKLPINWGPKGCKGVWTRQLERHQKCMGAQ